MKKKSLELRLPYFFRQRIHRTNSSANLPALTKPEPGWERAESGTEDILRWADDGGKMLDIENRTTASDWDAIRERRNKR